MADYNELYNQMEDAVQDLSASSVELKQMMTADDNTDVNIEGYGAKPSFSKQIAEQVGGLINQPNSLLSYARTEDLLSATPTTANILGMAGDTGKLYTWNGSSWTLLDFQLWDLIDDANARTALLAAGTASSLNQLALAIRSVYSLSTLSVASTGNSSLTFPSTGAIFLDTIATSDTGAPRHAKVTQAGRNLLDITLLPVESVSAGKLSSPYVLKNFADILATDFTEEASVVRVRYITSLPNQTLTTDTKNVFDKTGVWAAVTQAAASSATTRSISSHSAGGIQVMIPKSELTAGGYPLTLNGVRSFIAEQIGAMNFWYRTSVVSLYDLITFAIVAAGAVTVTLDTGITVSAITMVPPVLTSIVVNTRKIAQEVSRRQISEFKDLTAVRHFESGALSIPEDSMIEFTNISNATDTLTSMYRMVFSQGGTEKASITWPGGKTMYRGGSFFSTFKLFTLEDITFNQVAELTSSLLRVTYSLPAGFGVGAAGANYNTFDLTGVFYPALVAQQSAATRRSIAGTTDANVIQFILMISDLTAAGYTVTAGNAASVAQEYITSMARDSLFAGYTAMSATVAQTGYSDYFRKLLPAGDYTVSLEGPVASGVTSTLGGSYTVSRRKPARQVLTGNYQRLGADVVNNLSVPYTNFPVELKVAFAPGECPDSDALLVQDIDGNVFDCQFADEFHANPRQKSNTGWHADGSLAAGSIFINDTIASLGKKFYEVKAYNRRRQLSTEAWPQPEKTADGYQVTVGGYIFGFTRQNAYGLATITDPSGTVHNIVHAPYYSEVVSGAASDIQLLGSPALRLISTGPVFTEVEVTAFNRAGSVLVAGAVKSTTRYRLFKNGKVRIWVAGAAQQEIPVGVLYGFYSRLNMNDGGYTFDTNRVLAYWTDSVSNKRFSAAVVFCNGDIHRDNTTYGPTRPVLASALRPTTTTTRLNCGWKFTSLTDYSYLNWKVPAGWTWTHEIWIDCDNSITDPASDATNMLIMSQGINRPVGFAGECSYPGVVRQTLLDQVAAHIRGSIEWWKSADATAYGGGPNSTTEYYCHAAEVFLLSRYGISDLNTVYASFKAYMATRGSIINPGAMYTGGWWGLQFQSRLSIPVYEWLYKLAVKANDTTKINELKAGIKSLADAVMTYYNANGGIQLVGTATGIGTSNSNSTGLRILALAIYTGQDTSGAYLAAFNAVEALLLDRTKFMKAEGMVQDASTEYPPSAMYLHYQMYSVNNYVLACKMLNRTPQFDMVNHAIRATAGMGAFKEIDYCISESRRGGANTIAFALLPLLFANRASATVTAATLLDKFHSEYGPKPGFPKRFFGFDGTSASGDTMSEISFVAAALSDLWLSYNVNQ